MSWLMNKGNGKYRYMPDTITYFTQVFFFPAFDSQKKFFEVGAIIITIFQMGKLRLREVK